MLHNSKRRRFVLGDGIGVGKDCEICGTLLDHGRALPKINRRGIGAEIAALLRRLA